MKSDDGVMSDHEQKTTPGRHALLAPLALGLVVAIGATFATVRGHDFVRLDDPDYVTENPWVRAGLTADGVRWAFTESYAANWHPLTWMSHMLDVEMFGLDATGPHLVNVALHALAAVLLFLALHFMTRRPWTSLFVAALFALHPLRAESVAWVSERKDVLSGCFWMGTILAYAWYARRASPKRYAVVFLLLALGLMTKSMLVTLPCVLLLLDIWPLRRWRFGGAREESPERFAPRPVRALMIEKLPLLGLSVVSGIVTVLSQSASGAVSTLGMLSLGTRLGNALESTVLYLAKTAWPVDLACFYPMRAIVSPERNGALPSLGAAAVLIAISVLVVRGRRNRPYLLVGWLWYLGTLVPVIGLVQVGEQAMADRYSYLPLVGIVFALAWTAHDLIRQKPALRQPLIGVGAVVLLVCAFLTAHQAATWKDTKTLFEHALAVTERNYRAHELLGVEFARGGDRIGGARHLEEARAIKPHDTGVLSNLAIVYSQEGRAAEAKALFEEALRLDPHHLSAHLNFGVTLFGEGAIDEAAEHFERVLRIDPEHPEALLNLGLVHQRRGERDAARRCFETILARRPEAVDALYHLGALHLGERENETASTLFTRALLCDPNHVFAHRDLGLACERLGNATGAVQYYRRALELDPSRLETANSLALLYAGGPEEVRNGTSAVQWAERIAEATGYRDPVPLTTLAAAYAEAARFPQAVEWQTKAIELAPPAQRDALRARLELYRSARKWRMADDR